MTAPSTVRIYCPLFPYPFSEAAFQTMFNQATSLVRLGLEVEMVVWKSGVDDAVRGLKNAPSEIVDAGFSVRFLDRFSKENSKKTYSLMRLKNLGEESAKGGGDSSGAVTTGAGGAFTSNVGSENASSTSSAGSKNTGFSSSGAGTENPNSSTSRVGSKSGNSSSSDVGAKNSNSSSSGAGSTNAFNSQASGHVDNQFRRVLRALASGYASPELFYYPPELDVRADLPAVDVAIYHYSFSYAWLKNGQNIRGSTEKRQIVHFHNLECDVFRARAKEEKSFPKKLVHLMNAGRLDRHERELSKLVDEIWQHSPMDLHDYKLRTGFEKQRSLPPTMSQDQFERRRELFRNVAGGSSSSNSTMRIGFVGGLDFEPNRSSAAWILSEVAPLLKAGGFKGELVFAGKGPPPGWLDAFPKYDFVKFLGFVPSLEDFWASLSYLLVPHITGGGVRLKLLEALGSALPVVANLAAVRRLVPEVRSSKLLYVSDSPAEWAQKFLGESAFESRRKLLEEPFCEGINGELLYGFMK